MQRTPPKEEKIFKEETREERLKEVSLYRWNVDRGSKLSKLLSWRKERGKQKDKWKEWNNKEQMNRLKKLTVRG